jgi:hypothetical protein
VAGAVPGLDPKHVDVIGSTAPPAKQRRERLLAQLGPITVTQASLSPLKALFGSAIVLNLVLLSLLAWLWTRSRRDRAQLAELERSDTSAGES